MLGFNVFIADIIFDLNWPPEAGQKLNNICSGCELLAIVLGQQCDLLEVWIDLYKIMWTIKLHHMDLLGSTLFVAIVWVNAKWFELPAFSQLQKQTHFNKSTSAALSISLYALRMHSSCSSLT